MIKMSSIATFSVFSISGIATAAETSNSAAPVAVAETPPTTSDPQTHTVRMTDGMIYDPEVITISPGDTVKWINVGAMGHSITAYEDKIPAESAYWASGDFESENDARGDYPIGNIAQGESYSHTFDAEGEHEYFCIPHESIQMVGKVVVKKGGAQTQTSGASGSSMAANGEQGEDPEHMGVAFQAHWVGLATILGIFVSLVFTFFFLKYNETPHSGYPKQK